MRTISIKTLLFSILPLQSLDHKIVICPLSGKVRTLLVLTSKIKVSFIRMNSNIDILFKFTQEKQSSASGQLSPSFNSKDVIALLEENVMTPPQINKLKEPTVIPQDNLKLSTGKKTKKKKRGHQHQTSRNEVVEKIGQVFNKNFNAATLEFLKQLENQIATLHRK